MREIEINDSPRRADVTRKQFITELTKSYKVSVTTKGRHIAAGAALSTPIDRALYLLVEAKSQFDMDEAVKKINAVLAVPVVVPEEHVYVNLQPIPGFDVVQRLLGPARSFVNHIASTTQSTVTLRGRGSVGFSQDDSIHHITLTTGHDRGLDGNGVGAGLYSVCDKSSLMQTSRYTFTSRI